MRGFIVNLGTMMGHLLLGGSPSPPPGDSFLLLSDGSSFLLLVDGSSKIILA